MIFKQTILSLIVLLNFGLHMRLHAQFTFHGRITTPANNAVPFATIQSMDGNCGSIATINGSFQISCNDSIFYIRCLGYSPKTITLSHKSDNSIQLIPDMIGLNQFVVSANRTPIDVQNSPLLINTISTKVFQQTQSFGLVDGLKFAPGVRTENNCQSCGFSGVRLNGLPAAYTQILVNSRPIYSALQSIYGLEQIPTIMLDRVEISKGAGSVMFGGNAIAGTVNIITKTPLYNETKVESLTGLIGNSAWDAQQTLAVNRISKNGKHGLSVFLNNRNRQQWDANNDGFTEIPKLNSTGGGFNSYSHLSSKTEVNTSAYILQDNRRGGNDLQRPKHESLITEAIAHQIAGASLNVKHGNENKKGQLSFFAAGQRINRSSYYGGSVLLADSINPLNAYGSSEDYSGTLGLQFNRVFKSWLVLAGSDLIFNKTNDQIGGYNRLIDQQVNTSGTYIQVTKKWKSLSITPGIRYDFSSITSFNQLGEFEFETKKNIAIPLPRLSMLYVKNDQLRFRFNAAKGYRGPQAFDEDLHIEMAAGNPQIILLSNLLNVETSSSLSISSEYSKQTDLFTWSVIPEFFITELNNPFVLVFQSSTPTNGIFLLEKQNGSNVRVGGFNLQTKLAYREKIGLEAGLTLQKARYLEEQEIASDDENSTTSIRLSNLLRTPESYGFITIKYLLNKRLEFDYNGIYTGSMYLTQLSNSDASSQNAIALKETRAFFEHSLRLAYKINPNAKRIHQLTAGVRNFTNSYQNDLGIGPNRDASYVYGPNLPRTYTLSLSFSL